VSGETSILDQIAYYRARASEYDEWFYRQGRYDRGAEENAAWFADVDELMRALRTSGPFGRVLELACGTGIWTRELLPFAETITALDAAPEMLALHARNITDPRVRRAQVDLFHWEPEETYDLVFFSFWLSHVPPERVHAFLSRVAQAVRPGGRLFLVDSLPDVASGAADHTAPDPAGTLHERKLNDGRVFTIVKVFYDPGNIAAKLERLGFSARSHRTPRFFWWVTGTRGESGESVV
jgi:demethylmenaquinone methyltransferase/2-methoxy-6-polyprenyl-1,4-benzoquinol methylase